MCGQMYMLDGEVMGNGLWRLLLGRVLAEWVTVAASEAARQRVKAVRGSEGGG